MSFRSIGRKLDRGFNNFGKKLGVSHSFGNKLAVGLRKGLNTVADVADAVAPVATLVGRPDISSGISVIGDSARAGASIVNRGRKLVNKPSSKQLIRFVDEVENMPRARGNPIERRQT